MPETATRPSDYLDYWPLQLEADRRLTGARELAQLATAGSVFVRTPEKLTRIPALVPAPLRKSAAGIIETWDRGLGSFNHLVDGTGDLLRGASMILQENQRGSVTEFPVVTTHPADVVDAFLDITDQLDMGAQKPSHGLLVAGELVHKAAWTEQDETRQSSLFDVADRIYGRIYDDAGVTWGADKLAAAERRSDIRFHKLSQQIRKACRGRQDVEPFRQQAMGLLRSQIGDFFEVKRLIDESGSQDLQEEWAGSLLEVFASIVVRDKIYVHSPLKGNHPEIRSAFTSEDEPKQPRERKVNSSYDRVIDRVTSNDQVIAASAVQMKLGNGLEHVDKPYHPAIAVVVVKGIGSRIMAEAVRDLRNSYDTNRPAPHVNALRLVRSAMEPYLRPAKAA